MKVRFSVSSAAKLSYSGRKLTKGSRKVKSGAGVLTFTLPRKHGNPPNGQVALRRPMPSSLANRSWQLFAQAVADSRVPDCARAHSPCSARAYI